MRARMRRIGSTMETTLELVIDHLQQRVAALEEHLLKNGLPVPAEIPDETSNGPRRDRLARETAELLNRIGPALVRELDQQKIIRKVTDIATALVRADSGSFLNNEAIETGELSRLFAPVFEGRGLVRVTDIAHDARYGLSDPNHGWPTGDVPVRSYLAVPVTSRSGEVLGGMFFSHSEIGRFTEREEALAVGVAAHAAIALDNARAFEQSQWTHEELKRTNAELRRANMDLETFAYSASHDLQEPLRTVALNAQLLELYAKDALQSHHKEFLQAIVLGARHMQTVVRDLLVYTQAVRQTDGSVTEICSQRVLADVLETLREQISGSGARVVYAGLPSVVMREFHLGQLFQNLIRNALKYCRSEAPVVRISAEHVDGWTVFSVEDNGIGIESQYADQIFVLFKRLHTREEYPGSGIGLSICQRVVEQYGGRIWLDRSVPGEGSTFCFSIPDHR